MNISLRDFNHLFKSSVYKLVYVHYLFSFSRGTLADNIYLHLTERNQKVSKYIPNTLARFIKYSKDYERIFNWV